MMSERLPEIHALWIGNRLGDISRCCLSSFVMKGHRVFLHTYSEIEDLPQNIICLDANLIIPQEKIFKHKKTGSYALFSDLFRYELLRHIDGIYIDCDVYCLKPVRMTESQYILGYESDSSINGAILALPKESEVLNKLLDAAYNPEYIPPWYKKSKQNRFKIKKIFGIATHIVDMPWGVIGPAAITYFMKQLNLIDKVQPIDIFYPIHYDCISLLLDKNLTIDDIVTKRTLCVHLYNEILKSVDLQKIDSNCILSKMLHNEI